MITSVITLVTTLDKRLAVNSRPLIFEMRPGAYWSCGGVEFRAAALNGSVCAFDEDAKRNSCWQRPALASNVPFLNHLLLRQILPFLQGIAGFHFRNPRGLVLDSFIGLYDLD